MKESVLTILSTGIVKEHIGIVKEHISIIFELKPSNGSYLLCTFSCLQNEIYMLA
ncbi:hypothetical protein BVRB_7g176010 [Beta vulgaris subsp. vulgaris]|nr:hypothetical protein BVRB_7g176010 [Beta vulgaris subsp. vulgaris]